MRLSAIALAVFLTGCGGKVLVEPAATTAETDASTPDVSSVDSTSDSTGEDHLIVQDTSWGDAAPDVSDDEAAPDVLTCENLPKKGKTACCNGKPCLGWCDPGTNECVCHGLKGGCWLPAVCCFAPYGSCMAESECTF